MRTPLATITLALALTASSVARAQDIDPYESAMARSWAHEARGDLAAAESELLAVVGYYPQDLAIALRIGWLRFRAGRYAEAKRAYEAAAQRSPGSLDAHAGAAWSLVKLGMCRDAEGMFRLLLLADPTHKPSLEGLSACAPAPPKPSAEEPSWRVTPGASFSFHVYPDHPLKKYGISPSASLDVAHDNGLFIGATYRYLHLLPRDEASSAWGQHEAYARVGYGAPQGGFGLYYALTLDKDGASPAHHFGVSARYSPFGDILLNGSASVYSDMNVFRIEPSWKIPIAGGLSIQPGFAVQRTSEETLGVGMLSLALERPWGGLWAGGKYGPEVRPVSLDWAVIQNFDEKIKWGAWGGGALNAGAGVRIYLSYSTARLEQSSGAATNGHFMTFGVNKLF